MQTRLVTGILICGIISCLTGANIAKIHALSYTWTTHTIPTGEFLSCFAHLYGNEYWQSKGFHFASIKIDNPGDESEWRSISVSVEGYSSVSSGNVSLGPTQNKMIHLTPTFTTDLSTIKEPTTATVTLKATRVDSTLSYNDTKEIIILPVDYLYWGEDGSLRPFSIVFSTPKADSIHRILNTANETTSFEIMDGYREVQGLNRADIVESQMRSVYNTFKALGINHVSSSLEIYQEKAQRIKTPTKMLSDYSGNSLEVALLFISAFESMQLRPYLLFTTGEVFVAIAEWSEDERVLALDTTLVASSSYEDARASGEEILVAKRDSDPEFLMVDVNQLRKHHEVTSIPYFDDTSSTELLERISKVSSDIQAAKTAIVKAKNSIDTIRDKTYDKPEKNEFRQKAMEEYTLAAALFDLGDYVGAKNHANQVVEYVSKVESPEKPSLGIHVILTLIGGMCVIVGTFVVFVLRGSGKAKLETGPPRKTPPEPDVVSEPSSRIACEKCGTSNMPTAKFCKTCGDPLQ